MSTNTLRNTTNNTRGGLKPNIQVNKNLINKPVGTKRLALSQATNRISNNDNFKLNAKPTNALKKPLASIQGNENDDLKKKDLCAKKSKIPKFSSPAKIKPALKKPIEVKQQKSELNVKNLLNEQNQIKFSSFKIPDNVEDIDINDEENVLLAPGFSNDIYMYLSHLEEKFKLKTNFLEIQQKMNYKMRARLVDWIVAVHHKFKLLPETLYLTIAIMDRFLEKVNVTKEKVQLVGVTAFFIACKYEEIYPPDISDFTKVCEAYSKEEILKMEQTILKKLNFVLSYPLPLHFLRRFSKAAHADQEIHTLAKYLMELGLLEYECSSWKPSLLAATSLYLTLHILANDSKPQWTETLAFYTNYKEDDLLKHVSYLSKVLLNVKDSKLGTIKSKYSNFKLLRISENEKLTSDYVKNMANKFEKDQSAEIL